MEIKFNQEDLDHVARHLFGAEELGGKFNKKITSAEKILKLLSEYLGQRINSENLDWIHNETSGTDTVEICFYADKELKDSLGLSDDDPLGYHYVTEVTEELKSRVIKMSRGNKGDDRIEVNVVGGISPKPTNQFIVHLKKRPGQEGIFIAIAYPGSPSPFLPNALSQTAEEYQKSKDYWDGHAFIKN